MVIFDIAALFEAARKAPPFHSTARHPAHCRHTADAAITMPLMADVSPADAISDITLCRYCPFHARCHHQLRHYYFSPSMPLRHFRFRYRPLPCRCPRCEAADPTLRRIELCADATPITMRSRDLFYTPAHSVRR